MGMLKTKALALYIPNKLFFEDLCIAYKLCLAKDEVDRHYSAPRCCTRIIEEREVHRQFVQSKLESLPFISIFPYDTVIETKRNREKKKAIDGIGTHTGSPYLHRVIGDTYTLLNSLSSLIYFLSLFMFHFLF